MAEKKWNPKVDEYLSTVQNWPQEMERLRSILIDCNVEEELKWGKPCYTFEGKNIAIIQGFKAYAALLFFKGVLLKDPDSILIKTGENTEVGRQLRFTDVQTISDMEPSIRSYIAEAIEIEKAGLKLPPKKQTEIAVPEELQAKLTEDTAFKTAFEGLTPGRQRAYIRHFAEAKQAKTRIARIEKYAPKILAGKGILD
ncbi:YdeI/OmpD-associated family protein [Listeria grayi]|uniref:YdeI/OmpD-associated family protein n=1 Tax=Listeria grayi TaxID=1641 RepID=UPI0016270A66|nr:YdeI/OmpD-associated family protein [Listeria grayi]MBC1921785.1 hypothetical protein [Listeria grayi]